MESIKLSSKDKSSKEYLIRCILENKPDLLKEIDQDTITDDTIIAALYQKPSSAKYLNEERWNTEISIPFVMLFGRDVLKYVPNSCLSKSVTN